MRRVVATGLGVTVAAAATTALGGALAKAVGVTFEVPDGGESIPVPGIAVMSVACSLLGVVFALGLRRWSTRPAARFVQLTVSLTAVSLAAPVLSGADPATIGSLVALHLVAAAVMIPALTWSLSFSRGREAPARPITWRSARS